MNRPVRVAIVGGGPAGCLVARRLADAGHDVTLFEAGERARATLDFASLIATPDLRFGPADGWTEPSPIRAKALGGATAINGMLASAPDSHDLATWDSAAGAEPGTARSALERVIADVSPQIATPGPFAQALCHRVVASTLDIDATGVLAAVLSARSGERRDAATVYLADAPSNLVVRTGVTISTLNDERLASFDHIVVSAGSLGSPDLVRSVVPDLEPHGGREHRALAVTVPLGPRQQIANDQPAVSRVIRWASGVDTSGRADVQIVVLDHFGWDDTGRATGMAILSLLSGTDRLRGAVHTADDRARLRTGLERLLGLLDAGGFDPANLKSSERQGAELDRWIDRQPNPVHHVTSTLPLGSIVGRSIVGRGGLVSGRANLSVIDASVLPDVPRADTMISVLTVAELLSHQLVSDLAAKSAPQ